jgi:hypothetical protein
MKTLDDLPFDPAYDGRAHLLQGVEKVRAFKDEAMRRTVYDIQSSLELKKWAKPVEPPKPREVPADAPPGDQEELERRYR